MARAHNCTNPQEGWSLYSHFLGGQLLIINIYSKAKEEESEDLREKRESKVEEAKARLLGYLYMIMRRMIMYGHQSDAVRMGRIVDFIVEYDLSDPEVRDRLNALHEELSPSAGNFEKALAQFRTGDIPKGEI